MIVLTTYEYKCPYCGSHGLHTTAETILYCEKCKGILPTQEFTVYHQQEVSESVVESWIH